MNVQVPDLLGRSRIVSVKQMAEVLGFSVVHLRRLYRSGKIPPPTKFGERKLGWPAGVVIDLVASKMEARVS